MGKSNLFRKIARFPKKDKFLRKVLPVVGGIVGHVLGGPAGAAAGAGIGKSITGRGNTLQNLMKGAVVGGAGSLGANFLGGALGMPGMVGGSGIGGLSFGGGPGGFASMGSGLGGGLRTSLGSIFGGGTLPGIGQGIGGPGAFGAAGNMSGLGASAFPTFGNAISTSGGALTGLMNTLGGPLNTGLLGAGLAGMLLDKKKVPKADQRAYEEQMRHFNSMSSQPVWPEYERELRRVKPMNRKYIEAVPGIETPSQFFEDVNPPVEYYKKGGYVKGGSSGQADDVKAKIKEGDYILNATDVSLIGDGNSENGAKRIKKEIEDKFSKSGFVRNPDNNVGHRVINAFLSHGEYRIPKEVVTEIGRGDNKKGAKVIDGMRKMLRSHKGVKHILPPKTKKLISYMR